MGTLIALIPFLQTVQLLIKPKWDFVMAQKLTSRLFCCPPAVCATSCKVKVRHSHNITTGRYWAAAAARPPGRDLFRKPFGYNYFYFTRVLSNIFIPPPCGERVMGAGLPNRSKFHHHSHLFFISSAFGIVVASLRGLWSQFDGYIKLTALHRQSNSIHHFSCTHRDQQQQQRTSNQQKWHSK